MRTLPCLSAIFMKGDNFSDFLFALLAEEALPKKGSTLEGKNLLLKEQILSFKSLPSFRREAKMNIEELLPL